MKVDETNEDRPKRQKVTHGADMELEGLVMELERDRLQRYSDCDFLMQVKQSADTYLDRIFSNDHRKREIVKRELIQLGVLPSVHVAEVFSSQGTARLVHRFGLTPGLAFDLRTGWDLNDPARQANIWSHSQHERTILIVGSWSGHSAGTSHMRWMMDIYRWQVARGRFFVHQYSGKLFRNAEFCTVKSILVSHVDGWRTFVTNCEEIHSNLSKLNCRSHVAGNCIVAVILGLTRIGRLQAFESGPTVEEPCPAEKTDYDQVYYDSVTGASLPSELCEAAMQLEIKYLKEMNVYTPCEHGAVKEQGLTPNGTRWVFTNKDDTEHRVIRARLVAQETKGTTSIDLTDASMTFAATHLLRDSAFFFQGR